MPLVGIIGAGAPGPLVALRARLADFGLVDARTVRISTRNAQGDPEALVPLSQEVVDEGAAVIAAVGAITARAVHRATKTIPIAYAVVVEPEGDKLTNPAAPDRHNMTGVTTFDPEQGGAEMALLRSVIPDLSHAAVLADGSVSECLVRSRQRAARVAGLHLDVIANQGPAPDLAESFAEMNRRSVQAVIVLEQPVNGVHRARIADLARACRLPAIFPTGDTHAGCLFTYGTGLVAAASHLAEYVQMLVTNQAKVADLPIRTLRNPRLTVNIETARTLGLRVPDSVLASAHEVITA